MPDWGPANCPNQVSNPNTYIRNNRRIRYYLRSARSLIRIHFCNHSQRLLDIRILFEKSHGKCEFQKRMRLRGAKSVFFHRSGRDCVQKSMRLVSEYTKVVATSFWTGATRSFVG